MRDLHEQIGGMALAKRLTLRIYSVMTVERQELRRACVPQGLAKYHTLEVATEAGYVRLATVFFVKLLCTLLPYVEGR